MKFQFEMTTLKHKTCNTKTEPHKIFNQLLMIKIIIWVIIRNNSDNN